MTSALFYVQSPNLPQTNSTVVGAGVEDVTENNEAAEQLLDSPKLPAEPIEIATKQISVVQEEIKKPNLPVALPVVATNTDSLNTEALHPQQTLIDEKINTLVAQVMNLENQNVPVTDAEIDSLLLLAQKELLTDRLLKANDQVDAMALLSEVEDELDRTFRGQLFEKLKDGFFKVRTAVADRNK
jgi:ABC-type phosphate transport system auxiliary subunit